VAATAAGVSRCDFEDGGRAPAWVRHGEGAPAPCLDPTAFCLPLALAELRAYFQGDLRTFSVPWVLPPSSPLRRVLWEALAAIPWGERRTYAELAASAGRPAAARAAGAACAHNPLALFVPCHRVVAAGGGLGGYGGGLWRKRWLLAHEAGTGAGEVPGPGGAGSTLGLTSRRRPGRGSPRSGIPLR
jgi:O-6-methylguanine DNA methyltransferase